MAWRIEIERDAQRSLSKLHPDIARRLLEFLRDRVGKSADPRSSGAPLAGRRFKDLWRYRVGDYRIIARIDDEAVVVLVVEIGHRREVYR